VLFVLPSPSNGVNAGESCLLAASVTRSLVRLSFRMGLAFEGDPPHHIDVPQDLEFLKFVPSPTRYTFFFVNPNFHVALFRVLPVCEWSRGPLPLLLCCCFEMTPSSLFGCRPWTIPRNDTILGMHKIFLATRVSFGLGERPMHRREPPPKSCYCRPAPPP